MPPTFRCGFLHGVDITEGRPGVHNKFVEEVFSEKGSKSHNGYLFGAKIGEGSYAKVKEVVDETTLVRRAVKIIKHNRLRKIQNGQENVERELRILNRVKHENVVRLIEVFRRENKNKLYVVMEFCMGSVQQLLDTSHENRLCDADTHRYFVDLINGLEYLHSVGIVHKDIKPANLNWAMNGLVLIKSVADGESRRNFKKCSLNRIRNTDLVIEPCYTRKAHVFAVWAVSDARNTYIGT
ncbi:hypothetical protein COOONC_22672 [Cooperia oncophora]